jgi:hypothetical protein
MSFVESPVTEHVFSSIKKLTTYVSHLIRTEEDLETFLADFSRQDILEFIRQQRSDAKWVVYLLTNMTFYVNKLFDHPFGARVVLSDHSLKNKAIVGLVT